MIYFLSNNKFLFPFDIQYISVFKAFLLLSKMSWISVDTETNGLDCHSNKLLLIQLGNKDIQIIIDYQSINFKPFHRLLNYKNLILQNAKFDLKFFYKLNIIPKGKIWDTMLAEQVLYNGFNPIANLAYLTKKYCNIFLNKTVRLNFLQKNYIIKYNDIIYSAKDIQYLEEIKKLQTIKANKKQILKAIQLENEFVKTLAYVEYCGIHLDINKWTYKYKNAYKEVNRIEKILNNWIIDNKYTQFIDKQLDLCNQKRDLNNNPIYENTIINWASSKQVVEVFEAIGIDVKANNKTGKSVAEKQIAIQKHKFEIIPIYLEYQTVRKDFTTYGEKFLNWVNPITNRIHPNFIQLLITSRLGCNNPNMQNLPADERTRGCFTAEKGNILIDGDYKAQEDIIFVNNSKEPKMIEFYQMENADGHSYVASLCFPDKIKNTPIKDIKKVFPKLRQQSKGAKFSIHYGGTGYTIGINLNLTEEEGNNIEKAYLTAFPAIHKYLEKSKALAKKRQYILISPITGRKVWANDYDSMSWKEQTNFAKLGCNYPIQGQSAELTKIGGIYFFNWILQNNYFNIIKISNLVHDEILVECPIEMTELVGKKLKEYMEKGAELYCKIVPLSADIEVNNHWVH